MSFKKIKKGPILSGLSKVLYICFERALFAKQSQVTQRTHFQKGKPIGGSAPGTVYACDSPSPRIYSVLCDHSPAAEVAGSLSHVNTKTVSCQRSYGRDKLIASLEQERALSSRGGRGGDFHMWRRRRGGVVFDGFRFHFSEAQLQLYCQPLQPWKGPLAEIHFLYFTKGVNVWAHTANTHKEKTSHTQRKKTSQVRAALRCRLFSAAQSDISITQFTSNQ